MKHVFYTPSDIKNPHSTLYVWVVIDGLQICKVCGLLEGSLTTDCPGTNVYGTHSNSIYEGDIDFIEGQWVKSTSPHSPRYR